MGKKEKVKVKEHCEAWRRWSPGGLEVFYKKYNKRQFVHPDPLEFLYEYSDPRDLEITGLIASSFAYGRVKQILAKTGFVLEKIGPPHDFVLKTGKGTLEKLFGGFKHRLVTGEELIFFLGRIRTVLEKYGSLNECFLAGFKKDDDTVLPALTDFVSALCPAGICPRTTLLSRPEKGSACKRLNLFLRWMIRKDEVDPGGWDGISPAKLIVPLDTHLHSLSIALGLTGRKQAGMRAALEITRAFREISPDDPVRYDFTLTRPGIQNDKQLMDFLYQCLEIKTGSSS
ncbi:MAG: TIGR02757 family protein [Nitrospiraceae bacterium]|nr:TIGR02757 family protein [Nitrospiraceae bacterium]MDA8089707.1 TIGR02757 family protein [Nitrospiraceae bacterium]